MDTKSISGWVAAVFIGALCVFVSYWLLHRERQARPRPTLEESAIEALQAIALLARALAWTIIGIYMLMLALAAFKLLSSVVFIKLLDMLPGR